MSWNTLLTEGKVTPHQTSRNELADLRGVVARNLADAAIPGLSTDNRFAIAYQAALLAAKMAIACAGYRVKGEGAHRTTFVALKLALGRQYGKMADYFDRCRRIRNDLVYDTEGVVSANDAEELFNTATQFAQSVENWIAKTHPNLS
ncbi:MAG: SAV_6107 family HEPN domain-containing protein [Pirellulales bacterium]|nr:SAV_6107 family HEPN domain-containing protein [Pirellulales bacterium]